MENGKLVMNWYKGQQVPRNFNIANSATLEKSYDDDIDMDRCSYFSDEVTETDDV